MKNRRGGLTCVESRTVYGGERRMQQLIEREGVEKRKRRRRAMMVLTIFELIMNETGRMWR